MRCGAGASACSSLTPVVLSWSLYGVYKQDYFLFFSNSQGIVLGCWFTMSALPLADAAVRRSLERAFTTVIVVLILCAFVSGYVLHAATADDCRAERFIGVCCTSASIAFYAMPLSTAYEVVKSRSAASLSLPLCCASLANASAWGLYGLSLGDWAIMTPNIPGVACALLQLYLIQRYKAPPASVDTEHEGLLMTPMGGSATAIPGAATVESADAVTLTVATLLPGRSASSLASLSSPRETAAPPDSARRMSQSRERAVSREA